MQIMGTANKYVWKMRNVTSSVHVFSLFSVSRSHPKSRPSPGLNILPQRTPDVELATLQDPGIATQANALYSLQ